MSTQQEDYRTCAAVVAKAAADLEAKQAFRRVLRAEYLALRAAGKVTDVTPPPYREPHPVTAEVQARFYSLRRAGKSLRQIAAETGFGASTIVRYTRNWRLTAA